MRLSTVATPEPVGVGVGPTRVALSLSSQDLDLWSWEPHLWPFHPYPIGMDQRQPLDGVNRPRPVGDGPRRRTKPPRSRFRHGISTQKFSQPYFQIWVTIVHWDHWGTTRWREAGGWASTVAPSHPILFRPSPFSTVFFSFFFFLNISGDTKNWKNKNKIFTLSVHLKLCKSAQPILTCGEFRFVHIFNPYLRESRWRHCTLQGLSPMIL